MATGISIHIGLNHVDPAHYLSPRQLRGCVNDAQAMAELAQAAGFTPTVLLDEQATSAAVTDELQAAAKQLAEGDILLLTYSGHGSFIRDSNQDENDGRDETWCLFDRQMPDDEIYGLWADFAPGVRIMVLSDSCHSGSVAKFARDRAAVQARMGNGATPAGTGEEIPQIRAITAGEALQIFQQNEQVYIDVQDRFPQGRAVDVKASVLLISACQDWEVALDGPNGVFTAALLRVWSNGAFAGTYLDLHSEIFDRTALVQRPNYYKAGMPAPAFETQRAFTI